ncbi:MAG: sigma 54-interacting transcriptional regulator [Pseudomonadota bacterium]
MRLANHVGGQVSAAGQVGSPSGGVLVAGRYRLGKRLGAGGEGETFAAIDEMTGAARALKLFRSASPPVLERVRGEFERLKAIDHPGVVRAVDVGRDQGRLFLVTALVAGDSIGTIAEIADDDRRLSAFARAAREVADALAYLHARGVVHGDVSPENIRLAEGGRAVLIDLGLSGLVSTGGAIGTLGFAAPEALVGQISAASDLFGLGASLFLAWAGTGPFGAGAAAVDRMLASPAPRLAAVRPGLPEAWERIVDGLLQTSPARRTSSARGVLRQIARALPGGSGTEADILAPFPTGDPLAGAFVGRARELAVIKDALDRLAEGACPHAAIAVVGAEGSGRRTLIDLALRDVAIAQTGADAPPLTVFRGPVDAVAAWLGVATEGRDGVPEDDPIRARESWFARIVQAIDRRSAEESVCVALPVGADEHALAGFAAGAPASGRWMLLAALNAPLARVGALDLPLPPLSAQDIGALASRAAGDRPPEVALARVVAAAAGHAATATVLVRQLIQAMRGGDADRFMPANDAPLAELLRSSLEHLPPAARRFVARVALGIGPEARDSDSDSGDGDSGGDGGRRAHDRADEDAARAAGWIGEGHPLRLPSPAHESALRRALADADLEDVVREAVVSLPAGDGRRGHCLEALGDVTGAVAAFHAASGTAGGNTFHATRAMAWLEEAARLAPASLSVDQTLALATALALAGRGETALALLETDATEEAERGVAAQGIAAADRLRLIERRAWLRARAGDLPGARRILERAIADAPQDTPPAALVLPRARLARVLVSMGRFTDAVAAGGALVADPGAGALALESMVLAHAYAGDQDTARRLLSAPSGARLAPARATYLAALIDHLGGDLTAALDHYRQALLAAEGAGDIHTLAAIALNLGALAAEAGRYDEALAMHDRAIRELGRLGATSELSTALFNAGMLLTELGDTIGARGMLARLQREATGHGAGPPPDAAHQVAFHLAFLEGELALREGNEKLALDLFTTAARAAGANLAGPRTAAQQARAELLAPKQPADATAILDELQATASGPRADADLRLTRGRILLSAASEAPDAPGREAAAHLAAALASDATRAARAGRRPHAWRAALVAARLFHRAADGPRAAAALAAARTVFEEIRMATPTDHQPGLEMDRDARILADLARLGGATSSAFDAAASARGARAARSEDRLRRLLRINKRLNSELRLPRLLELIMDTVIELTEAERGFILLEDDKGELAVKVARNIDQQSLESGAFDLSRSIARQAAAGGVPIVTIDAAGDPRFRESLSVTDLHLRSVLAVPLQVKSRPVGTLYVDNRLRKGAFDEDDVQLVLDFAEQAGIAIGNARLMSELRRRERQIEILNRRLESELALRKEELVGMKQELRENREALAIRYDYRNIVGRAPRMLDLFRLLDRLTDTALPVVIQGESGTGKELVARALHFNGPRRERAFVSENCAAIPETLLESTLFGATRGAYTGADHDSRGLFEVADGGTLFLDEVGEMSPGMQGKLLRVLQSGELRRVGGERTRRVDVRIIAATNRDLGRMVEEGKFRQDLFFRLSVAPIVLPPLRERREDIPAIVEHILAKVGGGGGGAQTARRMTPEALARLVAYRWPGNVRELENEIMRAAALTSGAIAVTDLSPHVAGAAEAALTAPDDPDNLALRPRVERLERALLREAMSRLGGNQTRAAEALGLSRFGLQKKLRRYKIG